PRRTGGAGRAPRPHLFPRPRPPGPADPAGDRRRSGHAPSPSPVFTAISGTAGGARTPDSTRGGRAMAESVYKIIELVGTSTESWEKAAAAAVQKASKTLRDLRIAEISELDIQLENGKIRAYRAKVKLSFKYE